MSERAYDVEREYLEQCLAYLKTLLHLHELGYATSMTAERKQELEEVIQYIEGLRD